MSAQLRVHVCVHVYMAMVESCYRVTWGSRPFCFPKVSFSTLTFITEVCLFILKDSLNRWCKWKGGPLAETEGMSIKHHHLQGQVPLAQLGQLATGCLGIEGKSLEMGAEVKDW